MALTHVNIAPTRDQEILVPVEVDEQGTFSASWDGEMFAANRLEALAYQLRELALSRRTQMPFVGSGGTRGVIRGYHAGNRDLLVTWEGGEKGRFSGHTKVFRPESISDEEIAEIKRLEREIEEKSKRLKEIRTKTENADDLYNEALGFEITSWEREKEALAES